jgi:hypothetical protein
MTVRDEKNATEEDDTHTHKHTHTHTHTHTPPAPPRMQYYQPTRFYDGMDEKKKKNRDGCENYGGKWLTTSVRQ